MTHRLYLTLTCLLLAACAGDPANGLAEVVSSSPRSVVVMVGESYYQEAQNVADKECRKHGRHAQRVGYAGDRNRHQFDCVL